MNSHYRTWVPFLLVGLTLIGASAFLLLTNNIEGAVSAQQYIQEEKVPLTESEYQDLVSQMFHEVDAYTADYMHDALLDMRVPAAYRDVHLRLVVALDKMRSGQVQQGQNELDQLGIEYKWLIRGF